jgi:hypothetical protein
MHQAAIKGLKLKGDKLQHELSSQDKMLQERRSRSSQSPHKALEPHRSKSPVKENRGTRENDVRNIITQARVNRSRYKWDEGNYEDEETEMGASCLTRRVHRTQIPKGFKLPHNQQKYDGSQEPESWLTNYLQAAKILGGSKATAMQSLQLHLTDAA